MTTATKKAADAPAAETTRKAWVPKTPVDVVLEQIGKAALEA